MHFLVKCDLKKNKVTYYIKVKKIAIQYENSNIYLLFKTIFDWASRLRDTTILIEKSF